MEKRFCDKCGNEMSGYNVVKVELGRNGEPINPYIYVDLCKKCERDFEVCLNSFIPNFMGRKSK